tara:strand:+ start:658 stop:957 length:300 start_codon:yes stop_codon:yes gene_type:complete
MKNQTNTLNRISELENVVSLAKTFDAEGRNQVVNACSELYNLVEGDYYSVGAEVLIKDMYNDLKQGDFAAPFMCEQKKQKFELYKTMYINNVFPKMESK